MSEPNDDADGVTRILYIDDDEGLGVLLCKNLARKGYDVHLATSGSAGLERLAEGGIDAIVLDHFLKGETGLDILATIVAIPDHPPVIYATGSSDTSVAVSALKMGADDYVLKGVVPDYFDLLVAALDQGLERARFRRETMHAQQVIREQKDRAELLLAEVNHRIANSLGLVVALIRMQASVTKDRPTIDALHETQLRINAIANVHRRLYTSHKVGTVQLEEYLENLLNELEASMNDEKRPHHVILTCDALGVPTDKAITLGLIISELVTNAFKYAYDEEYSGEIRVAVKRAGDRRVSVQVEDDGAGFDHDAPARGSGLGTRLLSAMSASLKTEIRYEHGQGGTRATLEFDLD